jgi:hypothetical protein
MQDLWNEARPGLFLQTPIYVMSPEWEFLCLVAHAAKHHWQGLKWIMDIHMIAQRGDICWESVAAKSRLYGLEPLVRWSLSICHGLLGTPIPAGFVEEWPPRIKVFPLPPADPSPVQDLFLFFNLSRPPGDLARLVLRRLFVPTVKDWGFWRLPSSLSFLYYFLRPVRVGFAVLRSLLITMQRWVRKMPRQSQSDLSKLA